jgi:hypothetical protein
MTRPFGSNDLLMLGSLWITESRLRARRRPWTTSPLSSRQPELTPILGKERGLFKYSRLSRFGASPCSGPVTGDLRRIRQTLHLFASKHSPAEERRLGTNLRYYLVLPTLKFVIRITIRTLGSFPLNGNRRPLCN